MSDVLKYLDEKQILFLDAATRDEVIQALIDSASKGGKLPDKENFYNSILAREQVVSTGIGMGVALPHAKIPDLDRFFIGIAILKKGIDWDALDGAPVRIVFMIGGPDDKQTEYLQVLSGLTHAVKSEDRRKRLLAANTPHEIIALFEETDD
jgi:PTS system nitrogen regulatory IIA component